MAGMWTKKQRDMMKNIDNKYKYKAIPNNYGARYPIFVAMCNNNSYLPEL